MAVLDRVFASTCLTMTTQAREGDRAFPSKEAVAEGMEPGITTE